MGIRKTGVAACIAASMLVACGGGGDGDQAPKVRYSSLVSFGDSLSDVGTHGVGSIATLGGGKYTVNGASAQNWTQRIATQVGLTAPCPAVTGLNGDGSVAAMGLNFVVARQANAACTNYAQGGSRVTGAVGIGNRNLPDSAALGQLTEPVAFQINDHLTRHGDFKGTELVTVMAGGNDAFVQLGALGLLGNASLPTYATGVAGWTSTDLATVGGAGANVLTVTAGVLAAKMAAAGTELATLVKTQLLAKGATRVVVINMPNLSRTPFADAQEASNPGMRAIVNALSQSFNAALAAGLGQDARVRLVDAYTVSTDQVANPSQYGLSNVTGTACNLATPAPNVLGSSLVCNASNVNSGDVSKYLFADSVHPTPYGYQLLAQLVAKELAAAGWL